MGYDSNFLKTYGLHNNFFLPSHEMGTSPMRGNQAIHVHVADFTYHLKTR